MQEGLFQSDDRPYASEAPSPGALFARVAVERGFERAEDPAAGLTYAVPTQLAPELRVGDRVRVPLGRGARSVAGLVLELGYEELLDGLSPSKVRWIDTREGRGLPPRLIDLAVWLSRYYVCPLGMVAATMTPAAVKKRVGAKRRLEVTLVDELAREALLETTKLPPQTRRAYEDLIAGPPPKGETAKDLARRLGLKSTATINRLIALGLLEEHARQVVSTRGREAGLLEAEPHRFDPTPMQQAVIDGVADDLDTFQPHLLFGVTGSGKTEVYLGLIDRLLGASDDASALVLVPEISLTPQALGRFEARFGPERVAVLHSGLTATQRHHQWTRVESGEARVIVGARSAVFAPARRLGLIVVDEEHDGSYKQDQLPRYHARDVAIKRAQIERCPILLGSATPSLESWRNAIDGRFGLWRLPERVGGAELPRVHVLDLIEERRSLFHQPPDARWPKRERAIGPTLEHAIVETLATPGAQAILLLNRRGHATHLACPDSACGFVHRCDHCDAAMVTHRAKSVPAGRLTRCHHCRAEQRVPRVCPLCGKAPRPLVPGTQRVEEELVALFGDRFELRADDTLQRVDADTMAHAGKLADTLNAFSRGEVRVLLGTQMIAKGLDFPAVRLVGVISADIGLAIPDFRAAERTFQLVAQVAGRAGRGATPGVVLVQTSDPASPAIQAAAAHDFESFARTELAVRHAAGLPPAARMARVVIRHLKAEEAAHRARAIATELRAHADPALLIEGPFPCAIARIADHHRWSIDLLGPNARCVQAALAAVRARGLLKADAEAAIDVDPIALL
ncbi:MAG: primosomal protein N' [Planctomycetota bacterium]